MHLRVGRLLVASKSHTLAGRSQAQIRTYHDESFGFRKRKAPVLPDYTPEQLHNRALNAPLLRYVDSVRTHGHRAASIDPLDLLQRDEVAALDPTRYGLTDPSKLYPLDGIIWTGPSGPCKPTSDSWPLKRITEHMRETYVGRIAYEFMHSPSKTERLWFSHVLESGQENLNENGLKSLTVEEKRRIWELIVRSEVFDQFLQVKFPNLKRYGLEGGESMLPALDMLFAAASADGIEHITLAMPHRGRLNLLTDLLRLSPATLFHKIKGSSEIPEELSYSGDVISHLTASPDLTYNDKKLRVTLLPNPSHLEAVNPVAMGKTRAKQYSLIKEADPSCELGDKVMCVQLHGDASFTGQGVIMEGLGLSNLPHFTSGGSVHLVVNNSIGYTTPAASARSSLYCSDVGKMISAPVLHVNGDYPEDVARALKTAFKYRNEFRKDIVVDLIVYRRWGHNELDEPAFTQPLMYQNIRSRKSVPTIYEERLLSDGFIEQDEATALRQSYKSHLESELANASSPTSEYKPTVDMLKGKWSSMVWPASAEAEHQPKTGVEGEKLREIAKASVDVPGDFTLHPRLNRHTKARMKSIESGTGIDWATAEAMAFGSLMLDGYDVRISGQDVGRGTFSQRHAMLVNQNTEGVLVPLNVNLQSEGRLELANSSLSELAVLGFEYGISWETPRILPIWEAQFGDFFNGAQVIFDTFIASGETKWLKQSALVVLLPHGLDGAGPEHSSMRIERMLQLTNDKWDYIPGESPTNINMHVVYPTTPAQYFHLLRRQMKRNYRKPLIVASPKGLLRLSAAASSLPDLGPDTRFQSILGDTTVSPSSVKRLILLSGKIYYDLAKERSNRGLDDQVALVRIEELSPFPFSELREMLAQYSHLPHVHWLQEEPRNQGPWSHVQPRILSVLSSFEGQTRVTGLKFIGRQEDTVPAPGYGKLYKQHQGRIIDEAFKDL